MENNSGNNSVVQMQKIVKHFPGVLANDHVDFDLKKGEIHALLGENGAGKTTLMNILYGLYQPDEGEILLNGERVQFRSAFDAISHKLGMVHQHFMLVDSFTVAENIILGQRSPHEPLMENAKPVQKRISDLSNRYCLQVDPDALVWQLSVGEQQRVEILKTLYRGAEILIFDEPTAVLTPQEFDGMKFVFDNLRELGHSIVFIGHKLSEVLSISDRVTVMRDGQVVGTVPTKEASEDGLATMMVGRKLLETIPKKEFQPGKAQLELQGINVADDRGLPALRNLSLQVHAGEIVGIAGVAGNGQSELEEIIVGLKQVKDGRVLIDDQDFTNSSPLDISEAGMGHIPSDRYNMGMLADFSVAENMVLSTHEKYTHRGLLDQNKIRLFAGNLVKQFDVRTPSLDTMAGKLSGGNIQKMILARELAVKPKVLIAAQPTRGLDISATESIHKQLIAQRDAGTAILLISTELTEIMALSDRIVVVFDGQIVGESLATEADLSEIGLWMCGENTVDEVQCQEQ